MLRALAIAHLSLLATIAAQAELPDDLPEHTIRRTAGPIAVDGKLDEASWQAAEAIDNFVHPWWQEGEKQRTEAFLLWDDDHLYVAFIAHDKHISAHYTERDNPVSRDDCVEAFIAPDTSDVTIYFNFEFNTLGTILDRSPRDNRSSKWNAEGIAVKITVDGTLNDHEDLDDKWTTEIAIPFSSFAPYAPHLPPQNGDVWRLNLYRTGGEINPQYITWSNTKTPKPKFHWPERFGIVHFSSTTVPIQVEEKTKN